MWDESEVVPWTAGFDAPEEESALDVVRVGSAVLVQALSFLRFRASAPGIGGVMIAAEITNTYSEEPQQRLLQRATLSVGTLVFKASLRDNTHDDTTYLESQWLAITCYLRPIMVYKCSGVFLRGLTAQLRARSNTKKAFLLLLKKLLLLLLMGSNLCQLECKSG